MRPCKRIGIRSLILPASLLLSFAVACPGAEPPAQRFMATAGVNVFQSSSGVYREIYGSAAFMPEIKVTCEIYNNFTVWGGVGLVSKQGFIEEVDEEAEIRQTFFSIGVGYAQKLSPRLRWRGELGLAAITFKEEALGGTLNGSGLGWKTGASLDYFIGKKMFVTLAAAYSEASDEVETGKIKLGGLLAGVGLGFAF